MAKPLGAPRTAAQEILLGANDLDQEKAGEFTEWDLTIATWKRDPNRFGCRGYENLYPDHKRVMMEIMGTTKKENPIRRGWLEKTRPNHYRLTDLGRAQAARLTSLVREARDTPRSAQPIYDAVHPFFAHIVFKRYCKDPEEPRMWLGAASFLGITRNDAQHLQDRMRAARSAITAALEWLDETGSSQVIRGVTAGGVAISKRDLLRLNEFLDVIEQRFRIQITAIKKTAR